MFKRTEYILRNLSKISHKQYELYVISRIVHLLDDPEIEFVCQQLIRVNSGDWYLADICFPQLKMYLEIDELQHSKREHIISDKHRKREIVDATDFKEYRIKVFDEGDGQNLKSIHKINEEVDDFIKVLHKEKIKNVRKGEFIAWDPQKKFDPETAYKKRIH